MGKTRTGLAIGTSLQNLPAPIAAFGAYYGTLSPAWSLGIAAAAGILATFRDLAEARGREMQTFIEAHMSEFVESVVNSPDFIATLINIWELHIREVAEQKRRRLRNFLLSVGSNKPITRDIYTKVYAVNEQMTDTEALIFGSLIRSCNRAQFRQMHLPSTNFHFNNYTEVQIKDAWHSLHAYRLVDVVDDGAIGGIISLRQITPFGELFYDYVLQWRIRSIDPVWQAILNSTR